MLNLHGAYLRRHANVDVDRADAGKIVRPVGRAAFDAADIYFRVKRSGRRLINILSFEFTAPFFDGIDDFRHFYDGVHLDHRVGFTVGTPRCFGFARGLNLYLDDAVLRPDDVHVGAIAADRVVGVHAVGEQMARAGAFAAIFFGLPGTDGRARDLADYCRQNDITL